MNSNSNNIVSNTPLRVENINIDEKYLKIIIAEDKHQLLLRKVEKVYIKKIKKPILNFILLLIAISLIDAYFLYNISKMIMILCIVLITSVFTIAFSYNFYKYRFIIFIDGNIYDFKILKKHVPQFKILSRDLNAKIYKFTVVPELVLN